MAVRGILAWVHAANAIVRPRGPRLIRACPALPQPTFGLHVLVHQTVLGMSDSRQLEQMASSTSSPGNRQPPHVRERPIF